MKFNSNECKVVPWGRRNPQGSPGMGCLRTSLWKSAAEIKANSILGSLSRSKARKLRKVIISFSGLPRSCLDIPEVCSSYTVKTSLKWISVKSHHLGLGLEPCEERLREGDLLSQGRAGIDGLGHLPAACRRCFPRWRGSFPIMGGRSSSAARAQGGCAASTLGGFQEPDKVQSHLVWSPGSPCPEHRLDRMDSCAPFQSELSDNSDNCI